MIRLGLERNVTQWPVSLFAADSDLIFYEKIHSSDGEPIEVIWATRDGGTSLHFIEDPILDLKYLMMDGPEADRIWRNAQHALTTFTLDDALSRLSVGKAVDEQIMTASLLGLLAPPGFDQRVMDAFDRIFHSSDERVRHHGILAASYSRWPEFRRVFARLCADDPSSNVRERAAIALEAFDNLGVPQSD